MPLLKRKAYALSKPPHDLQPHELVFQVRFTKEIFKDYEEYLKKLNLYCQRLWTCKVTGKTNLTYEEALTSEHQATEKVQQFPKEYKGPVLKLVQFSVLRLDELVNTIIKAYKHHFVPGDGLVYLEGNSLRPCKVIRAIEESNSRSGTGAYEVEWLDNNKNVIKTSVESSDKLVRKKNPFTRALLKSFIRESVRDNMGRNAPWVVHEQLCREYKITTDPPDELKKFFVKQEPSHEQANGKGKRLSTEDIEWEAHVYTKHRRKDTQESGDGGIKMDGDKDKAKKVVAVNMQPIKYPIDDSLVQSSDDDPAFTKRPIPSSDFSLPVDCIGSLLMVWNFCLLFGKAIHLFPFSLEEFEKVLECKVEDPVLLREVHNALLHSALSDPAIHQSFAQKRKRKVIVSVQTWKDDLSDFLELEGLEKLARHSATVRNGSYRQLDPSVKLDILCELVSHSLVSSVIRDQLDLIVEEKQAISAQKRKEEMKKGKELQEKHAQTTDTDHAFMEASTRVHPEDSDSGENTDDGRPSSINPNGLPDTISSNSSVLVPGASRQLALKIKAASDQAEEREEDKNTEEDDEVQQKWTAQREALRVRKRQEKKLIELKRRQEQLEREIEKRTVRTDPLGVDRDYNRYWFFPREGRIFVEDKESTKWGYYSVKEELEALYGSLNSKGVREKALQRQLEKHYTKISDALQRRSKDIAHRIAIEEYSVRRSSRVKYASQQTGAIVYKNKYRSS